ncbi:hypothetical protein Micbo1qcDRAFT_163141 [Microdochium bolleyi]|uniref:Uncharacterized protein n=1 Tax=Microdochium bolleyi TaxID=196109 RepID=A0A136J2U7_9PEZI|nr:hypothetical protein Micbo1qcDRAFT_163141 [Microdochium bolleyi]
MEDFTRDDSEEVMPAASRKRKRATDENDADETEFKSSSIVNQQPRSKAAKKGGKRPGPKPKRQIEIADTADEGTTGTPSQDDSALPTATTTASPNRARRLLRKDDKIEAEVRQPAIIIDDDDDDGVAQADEVTVMSSGRKPPRSTPRSRASHSEARYAPIHIDLDSSDLSDHPMPVDDSPSRSREGATRRRQQQQQQQKGHDNSAPPSSPLTELSRSVSPLMSTRRRGSGGAGTDDGDTSSKKSGRSGSFTVELGSGGDRGSTSTSSAAMSGIVVEDEDEDDDEDESDDSALIIDRSRSRTRRKPARYED